MQEHWIGKSEGVRFAFPHDIRDESGELIQGGRMYVFTTRADTIKGVTFCAVAPEHPLAALVARRDPAIAAFVEECKKGGTTEAELALREKEGRPLGLTVTHPLTRQPVPLWVGNYVLMGYGDGAVMGVPAHDERDFAFAASTASRSCRSSTSTASTSTTSAGRTGTPTRRAASRQLGQLQRPALQGGGGRHRRGAGPARPGEKKTPGGCATGASAASATGARRSPSSIATPAATCRCRRATCRWSCPKTWCPTAAATR